MNEAFVRKRITELRLKKGVSEYLMSLELGHSKGYIQGISSGRAMPSWSEFFNICEYLGVTPADFFIVDRDNPALVNEILESANALNDGDRQMVLDFIKRLLNGATGK